MSNLNDILNRASQMTGYSLTSSSYSTIPVTGIAPGEIIKSEQILNIINALSGVNEDTIIISGSFLTSGSNLLDGELALPFIQEGSYLYISGGLVQGTNAINVATASYALTASYFSGSISNAISASYALSSSYALTASFFSGSITNAISASYAQTASYALNVPTSSISSSYSLSSSFALTASYALNAPTSSVSSSYSLSSSFALTASYANFALRAQSASYAETSSLPLLGIITASVNASTITFTRGNSTTFDIVIAQSGSIQSASYATFAENANTASYALTASYIAGLNLSTYRIATGSITASVNVNTASLFLIQSQSVPFFNIAPNSNTTIYSDLLIIKGFTSQQPVLTINGNILNVATHSFNPTGSAIAGNVYFTSDTMYIGLE